jgi:cyclopropane fatty-acyl-phospholipid synthase-like methyltransferase
VTYCVSEACERNKEPIRKILAQAFAHSKKVLEIGSGTGQHAVHFAAHFPHLVWQPTDTGEYLEGLRERIRHEATGNLLAPLELDVRRQPWQVEPVDALFTANTLHIMSWPAVRDFFHGLGGILTAPAVLCIYGPFRYDGRYTSPSNAEFDRFLRARDPDSGIRNFEDVNTLASEQGLSLSADHAMPANNQLLIWQKSALSFQTAAP